MTRYNRSLFALMLLIFTSLPTFAATVPIHIKDFLFQPNSITINLADSVKWTNQDSFPHTTTSDKSKWNSNTLLLGDSFTQLCVAYQKLHNLRHQHVSKPVF